MDSNKKLIGGGVVVLVLMTGAWMMGKNSAGAPNPMSNGFAPQGAQQQMQNAPAGMMNPGTGSMPNTAQQGAMSQYGSNPGAEMPSSSGQQQQMSGPSDMPPSAMPPLSAAPRSPEPYESAPNSAGGNQYRDPQGQFTIQVPAGWQSTPQNGGVIITRGAAMVVVSPFNGAQSGEQIVSTLARQYGSQWGNLQVSDKGQFSIGGAPAAYMMMSGRSPRGTQSLLRIAGAVSGSQGFAVIISAPLSEFNSTAPQLQSIESSLSFGGGE